MTVSLLIRDLVRSQPKGVWLKTTVRDDAICLDLVSVSSPLRRLGLASKALAGLLDLADRSGMRVELDANPTGYPSDPEAFALARWYASFGFEPVETHDDGVRMARAPRPPVGVAALIEQSRRTPPITRQHYLAWRESGGGVPSRPARPRS